MEPIAISEEEELAQIEALHQLYDAWRHARDLGMTTTGMTLTWWDRRAAKGWQPGPWAEATG